MPLNVQFVSRTPGNLVGSFVSRTPANLGVSLTLGLGDLNALVLGEVPGGAVDGVNEDYTTAANFAKLWVWLNGLRMKLGTDYNITGLNTFHFLYPPSTGDILLVDYVK